MMTQHTASWFCSTCVDGLTVPAERHRQQRKQAGEYFTVDLDTAAGPVAWQQCRSMCLYLQMGIANRDIKLENTLLMDDSPHPLLKLCDFGYSKDEYQGSACKTLCGEAHCCP